MTAPFRSKEDFIEDGDWLGGGEDYSNYTGPVTPGKPGSYSSTPPALGEITDPGEFNNHPIYGAAAMAVDPAWPTDTWVFTSAGSPDDFCWLWDGSTWVTLFIEPGEPGTWSVRPAPANLSALRSDPVYGTAQSTKLAALGWEFNLGDWMVLGDSSQCHWDGDSWEAGPYYGTGPWIFSLVPDRIEFDGGPRTITINGQNFTPASTITLSSNAHPSTYVNPITITFVFDPGGVLATLGVEVHDGGNTSNGINLIVQDS
jgi:hypothetical protein